MSRRNPEVCLCATTEGYRCPVEGHAARWCREHPMFDAEGREVANLRQNDAVSAFDLRDAYLRLLRRDRRDRR